MNKLGYDNSKLLEKNLSHQLAAVFYSFFEILNRFFLPQCKSRKIVKKSQHIKCGLCHCQIYNLITKRPIFFYF